MFALLFIVYLFVCFSLCSFLCFCCTFCLFVCSFALFVPLFTVWFFHFDFFLSLCESPIFLFGLLADMFDCLTSKSIHRGLVCAILYKVS